MTVSSPLTVLKSKFPIWSLLYEPLHISFDRFERLRLVPDKSASYKSASLKLASLRFRKERSAFLRHALCRFTRFRNAVIKMAFERSALLKLAQIRLALTRVAPLRLAATKFAESRLASRSSAPSKLAPFKLTPPKLISFRFIPRRSAPLRSSLSLELMLLRILFQTVTPCFNVSTCKLFAIFLPLFPKFGLGTPTRQAELGKSFFVPKCNLGTRG